MHTRVLLCGVGGQGTILAAHVLAEVAMACGKDVKVSEIHGMAQRGGSVTTVVTFGDDVKSMVCTNGEADILVSFDKLEALRNIGQAKRGARLVVNDATIKPTSVLTGKTTLPKDGDEVLSQAGALLISAEELAREAGNIKTQNVVLLGALSAALDFDEAPWTSAIETKVPAHTLDVNLKAFELGRAAAS